MSQFERVYQIDPERGEDQQREKHPSIELSDQEYLSKFVPAGQKETKIIILHNEPPSIPMNLEMPELEKAIKQGKKNAKGKSKSIKGKSKKNNTKANKPAVASV